MKKTFTKESLLIFNCFKHLSPTELNQAWDSGALKSAGKFETFFSEGEPCSKIFFLLDGCVKIYTCEEEEKEHISCLIHPYTIFGECCLMGGNLSGFSAQSIDDENVYFEIDQENFILLMKQNFNFNLAVLEIIGSKIAKKEERLRNFATKDARSRIVEFLKDNAYENGRQIGYELLVKHNLTQQDIAVFTGTSRQTVTTVLNDMKSKNQIYLKRKSILIRDVAKLY